MQIYHAMTELIGRTPLLQPERLLAGQNLPARLLLKLEGRNPGGSAKDRVAYAMLLDAQRRGLIRPGSTVIEPTSGNTGIGLAWIGRLMGYRVILTMPDTMSQERRSLLAAYGAQLVLTPGEQGMDGAVRKARELAGQIAGSFIPQQFENPANPAAHAAATGEEIWQDTDGQVDALVATVGTGGTITGSARALKAHNPALLAVAVEPAESPLISQGRAGKHGIQGLGANFVPEALDRSVLDEVLCVATDEARAASAELARAEGLLAGISSGACLVAALRVAARPEVAGKTVVAILPDSGERYLSEGLFTRKDDLT